MFGTAVFRTCRVTRLTDFKPYVALFPARSDVEKLAMPRGLRTLTALCPRQVVCEGAPTLGR